MNETINTMLGLLYPMKRNMKLFNYYIVLYQSSSVTTYQDLQNTPNKMIFFVSDFDRIELCESTSSDTFDYTSGGLKYNFLSDDEIFNHTNDIDSLYFYFSKLIKWGNVPRNSLLSTNDTFIFNNIAFCYTPNLIMDTSVIPSTGILMFNKALNGNTIVSLNTYDNTSINAVVKLYE